MEALKINYAIYPSLLDAYLRFIRNDDDESLESLINKINNVRTPQSEQQIKGVEFEKLINACIDQKNSDIITVTKYNGVYATDHFEFKSEVVEKIAVKLQFATKKQEYLECIIPSHEGNIKLYGIADYTFPAMIVDLKTTGNYECNRYKDNTQHATYSLIKKVNNQPIKAFKYLVTDFDRVYQETYLPTDVLHKKLMSTVFEFIGFVNYFSKYITNDKVFGS
jgi:hypothetical protein